MMKFVVRFSLLRTFHAKQLKSFSHPLIFQTLIVALGVLASAFAASVPAKEAKDDDLQTANSFGFGGYGGYGGYGGKTSLSKSYQLE